MVQDKGLPTPLSATLPGVPITISDANDQNPTFNTTRYDFRVRENQDNVLVGTVYAEDLDDYKRTCYGLGRFHTPSVAFRHLLANSARFSYATEGTLFISAQLSSDAVSALRKVRVLIRVWKQPSIQART